MRNTYAILRQPKNRAIASYIAKEGLVSTRDIRREFLDYHEGVIASATGLQNAGIISRTHDMWKVNAKPFIELEWRLHQHFTPTELADPFSDSRFLAQIDLLGSYDACSMWHLLSEPKTVLALSQAVIVPQERTRRILRWYRAAGMVRPAGRDGHGDELYQANPGIEMPDVGHFVAEMMALLTKTIAKEGSHASTN